MKNIRSLLSFCLSLVLVFSFSPLAFAQVDDTDFVSDEIEFYGTDFTLDANDDAGAGDVIQLEFGATLSEYLQFDVDEDRFELSNDLALEGNELQWFRIENLAADPGACDGASEGRMYYNTVDLAFKYCSNNTWVEIGSFSDNSDTLDSLDSLQFLRSDTADSFTSGTLTTSGGTILDIDGAIDASGSTRFAVRQVASDPGTCLEGDVVYNSTDNLLKVCSATDTWSLVGGGSGGDADTLDTLDSTDMLRSNTSDNYSSGTLTFDGGTTLQTNGTLDVNGIATIGDGGDAVSVNSFSWDISVAGAMTGMSGITSTGGIDFSGASSFFVPQGVADPGTCAVGQLFFNTTDNLLRACTAVDTWTVVRDGGDADTLDTLDSTQLIRSDSADSYTSGTLTFAVGTILDLDGAVDASGATRLAVPQAAADPATCSAGDVYFNTSDTLLRACTAADTWTVLRDGGDADTLDTFDSADLLRSNVADSYTSGTLTFAVGTILDLDGSVDVSGATRLALPQAAADPATCSVGDVYFNTSDTLLRACTAVDTWTVLRDGGDADTLDTLDSTQLLKSDSADSYTSGTLTFSVGTIIDVDGNIDASGATRLALPAGGSNPATCAVGDVFFNTGDNLLRSCTAVDTWSIVRDGGNADTLDSLDSADVLRSNVSDNYTNGTLTLGAGTILDIDGNIDASGSTRLALPAGGSNPATCAVGDLFFNNGDNLLRACTAVDTWSIVRDGGNADTLDSLDSADVLRSNVADSYTNGTMDFAAGTTLQVDGTLDANGVVTVGDGGDNVTIDSSVWDISSAGAVTGLTDLDVDNLNLNGNTISSTDTNGNIGITPNGTGYVRLFGELDFEDITSDPGSPQEGMSWFRSDTDNLHFYADGRTQEVGMVEVGQFYDSDGAGGSFNINTAGWTAIPWDSESFAEDATFSHDTVTNNSRVTVNDNGLYRVSYAINHENATNGRKNLRCRIRLDGSTFPSVPGDSFSYLRNTTEEWGTNDASTIVQMTAGQYYEVVCRLEGSTGNVFLSAADAEGISWTSVELLRRE